MIRGGLVDNPHYYDVIMVAMPSQITSFTIVYSTVYSGTDQRENQNYASLTFVRGIHRWPVNSPHKGPVTRKMFPFDDVIIVCFLSSRQVGNTTPLTTSSDNFKHIIMKLKVLVKGESPQVSLFIFDCYRKRFGITQPQIVWWTEKPEIISIFKILKSLRRLCCTCTFISYRCNCKSY